MNKLYMIYSADENWAIGKNNDLLVKIPEDMRDRFKALTVGNTVLMGKNTLLSFPKKKGLPNRQNYVLTTDRTFECENATVIHSIDEFFSLGDEISGDVYVIGGGKVYDQLIDFCDGAFVTRIYEKFDDADTFVKDLDKLPDWHVERASDIMHSEVGVDFAYIDYVNSSVRRKNGE